MPGKIASHPDGIAPLASRSPAGSAPSLHLLLPVACAARETHPAGQMAKGLHRGSSHRRS